MRFILVISETHAECGIKMKDRLNLLHRNGLSLNDNLLSTISAVFERSEVWLHELLIKLAQTFVFLQHHHLQDILP